MAIKRKFKHNLKNFTSLSSSSIRANANNGAGVTFYKTSPLGNANRIAITPETAEAVGLEAGMKVDVRVGKVAGKTSIAIVKSGDNRNYTVRSAGRNLQIDFLRVADIKAATPAKIHTQRGVLYITVP